MPKKAKFKPFAGLPARAQTDLEGAKVAILGIAEASPYDPSQPSHSALAPAAIRRASRLFVGQTQQLDFDTGATLFENPAETRGIVDLGDLDGLRLTDAPANRARITEAVRAILDAGAVPVVLGGDDSVPIPMFAAYEGRGPLTVVQVDAHVDWGDVIRDNPYGYGSTMRRAADLPWISNMVQIGIRGLGSGTADQIADAKAWGSQLFTGTDLRRLGMESAIDRIPAGTDCIVAIDCDGIDPCAMPAVAMPTPGGPGYQDILDLLHGIAGKARIAGLALVELVPERDIGDIGALHAARIVLTAVGLIRNAM